MGEVLVASAFFGTSLAATITAMGCDPGMFCGFSTSGCLRAITLDPLQHRFNPYVLRDACGDREARPQEANLFDLQAKCAEGVDADFAIRLLGSHNTPR